MYEDSLHRDADLTGVIVAAFYQRLDDRVDLHRAIDDNGCRSAVLKRATRAWRQFRAEIPADFCGADEAQKRHTRIRGETLRQGVVFDDQCLTPVGRQPCLMDELDETQTAQRRRVRRLDDDRAACGDGRHHLMYDEV